MDRAVAPSFDEIQYQKVYWWKSARVSSISESSVYFFRYHNRVMSGQYIFHVHADPATLCTGSGDLGPYNQQKSIHA